MAEAELQVVRVWELSYGHRTSDSRARVLNHHTVETRKNCWMNEWLWEMKVDDCWLSKGKSALFVFIWVNLAFNFFSASATLVASWHHDLFACSYHFLPSISAKYTKEIDPGAIKVSGWSFLRILVIQGILWDVSLGLCQMSHLEHLGHKDIFGNIAFFFNIFLFDMCIFLSCGGFSQSAQLSTYYHELFSHGK